MACRIVHWAPTLSRLLCEAEAAEEEVEVAAELMIFRLVLELPF